MPHRLPVRLVIALAVAYVAILAAVALEGRGPQTPAASQSTGLVMGVIVDALDDRPVANAEVTLGGTGAIANNPVLTDAGGHFVFLGLPKGRYIITATRAGYAEGAYGRRRAGGLLQTLTLDEGQRVGDLRIPLWKYGAITGTIRDEAGEPMVDVPVRVLLRTIVAGQHKLTPGAAARTDDRGVYRIGSLMSGTYAIAVPSTQASAPESVIELFRGARMGGAGHQNILRGFSFSGAYESLHFLAGQQVARVGDLAFQPSSGNMRAGVAPLPSSDGRIFVYPTVFYPATMTAAEAVTITLGAGEERAGVDVSMRLVPASRISGTVTGPDGPLIVAMTLVPDTDDFSTEATLETATTVSDAAGRFTFLGVPPGQYRLRAINAQVPPDGSSRGGPPPPPARTQVGQTAPPPSLPGFTLWATQSLNVDTADMDDLAITLRAGFRISGHADFGNASAAPDSELVRRMTATFDPADARPLVSPIISRGRFKEDGQLWSYQMPPGRYYLRINNAPAGWTLKAAIWNGQDISNVPLTLDRDVNDVVITFTDRPSTVSGQVRNASGSPDASATVLIFPADPPFWVGYGSFPRRLRSVRAGGDGRFEVSGLPAGDYQIVAVAEEASADWQDVETLRVLARVSTAIELADGESRSLPLQTVAVPR